MGNRDLMVMPNGDLILMPETTKAITTLPTYEQTLQQANQATPCKEVSGEVENNNVEMQEGEESHNKFNEYFCNIGRDINLTVEEKVREIQNAYDSLKDKTDVFIPHDPKYIIEFDSITGEVIYNWPKYLGFVKESIRPINRNNNLPNVLDRCGHMKGSNFSSIPDIHTVKNQFLMLKMMPHIIFVELIIHRILIK